MSLNEQINAYNKSVGYERLAKITGYAKPFGLLDKSGVVESILSRAKLLDLLK